MSICRIILAIFALLCLLALALFLIGTFGLFGQEKDPLSAVFLLPLGLPWNLLLDPLPDAVRPWAAALAPLLNLILLWLICNGIARRGAGVR